MKIAKTIAGLLETVLNYGTDNPKLERNYVM